MIPFAAKRGRRIGTFTMRFMTFLRDEGGAVTVDWVVLTAAIVTLGVAVLTLVSNGVIDLSGDISDALVAISVATYTN